MTDRTIQGQGRALCAKGLKKNYGSQQVLRDLDLTIEPGHIYGLIGRNGAGKTTLLSILTGQNTKNGGEVTYGGEPVWENPRALGDLCFARELNPSSEVAALKVEEYLLAAKLFCPRWDTAYADALLKKFGLDTKKRISKLSKGQMSMVTITAALASRAPVTILDEPAAGLDVVIIGTGDTASDCVATALRQGCRSVTQLVRRPRTDYLDPRGQLPADYAHQEAQAVTGRDPRRFGVQVQSLVTGENGALTGVVTTEGDTLPCQLLIGATGFAGCEQSVCDAFGVESDRTVRTAPGSYAASVEKVFAAGDMRRGQSLVVWAIAEGRSAAAEVDQYLVGYTNLKRSV